MPKLPRITGKEVLFALKSAGFVQIRVRGSHHYLLKPPDTNLVTVQLLCEDRVADKVAWIWEKAREMDYTQVEIEN